MEDKIISLLVKLKAISWEEIVELPGTKGEKALALLNLEKRGVIKREDGRYCLVEREGPGEGSLPDKIQRVFPGCEVKAIKINQEERRYPEVDAIKGEPCYLCGGKLFWISKENARLICNTCHPPPGDHLVAGWIEKVGEPVQEKKKREIKASQQIDWKYPVCKWCLGTRTKALCSNGCKEKLELI